MDTLHGEIEYLVGYLVRNDMNSLHKERIYLVRFSFIRVIDFRIVPLFLESRTCLNLCIRQIHDHLGFSHSL